MKKLILPTSDGIVLLHEAEVSFIKSENIYTYVYNGTQKIFTTYSLKQYEDLLDGSIFYRCHRSFIVNLTKIAKVIKGHNCQIVMQNGSEIPVSRKRKNEMMEILIDANKRGDPSSISSTN